MLLYVICTILQCVVVIMCMFLPTIYTQNFEYGRINGVGSVYNEGSYNTLSMLDFGGVPVLLISIIFGSYLLFLILVYKKQFNIVPTFLLYVLTLGPLISMIILTNLLSKEAKYIGNSVAVYGSGVKSGLTELGFVMIVISLLSAFVLSWSFTKYKKEYDAKGVKDCKVIKTKSQGIHSSQQKNGSNINYDDFSL